MAWRVLGDHQRVDPRDVIGRHYRAPHVSDVTPSWINDGSCGPVACRAAARVGIMAIEACCTLEGCSAIDRILQRRSGL